MAKLTRKNYDAIRDHIFDRIHKTGEEIKNDFPNLLRTAVQAEVWKQFRNAEGRPFANLVEWLHYTFPQGASMGNGKNAITYEEALKLTEGHKDVHRILAENAPKGKAGRHKKGSLVNGSSTIQFSRHGSNSGTKAVLAAKLAQSKPAFYDGYLNGKYKTVTEAATAAGILKGDVNLRRAKSAFRHMTAEQRAEFMKWLKSGEAKRLCS